MPRVETLSRSYPIPEGVTVKLDGRKVTVEGPLGRLEDDLSHLPVSIVLVGDEVRVETRWPRKREIGMLGTAVAHIRNMVKGVTKGYQYNLRTVYAHFPVTVKVDEKAKALRIENFTGEKTPRFAKVVPGVKIEIKGEDISVQGIDLKSVSQTAANIQDSTKIKKKDLRVFLDGIYVAEKGPIQAATVKAK